MAGDHIDHQLKVFHRPIAAGSHLCGLNQAVQSFQQTVVQFTGKPAQDALPVPPQQLGELHDRLQSRTDSPLIPSLYGRLRQIPRQDVDLLKDQPHPIGPRRLQLRSRQAVHPRRLGVGQIPRVLQPHVPGRLQARLRPLFLTSDLVHRRVEKFEDMEPVEGDSRLGQMRFHSGGEGRRHIAGHLPHRLRRPAAVSPGIFPLSSASASFRTLRANLFWPSKRRIFSLLIIIPPPAAALLPRDELPGMVTFIKKHERTGVANLTK